LKKSILCLIALIFLLCQTKVWAGPPFETDDPEPTDYQHWEIYLGATGVQTQGEGWLGTGPFLELNYGGFPDTQLSLTQQLAFSAPLDGPSAYGYGDTLVGVKYRFIHEGDEIPQVAFFPQVNIPTGDPNKALGYGVVQYFLPLWIQKSWGPWTTYGGGGYWINPGTGNKNWVFAGWELQRDFGENFTFGGEVFYHSPESDGQVEGAGFNLGGMIHFDPVNHIVFSAGRDLIQTTYTFTGYAAYEWTFPNEPKEAK
jgi:Putative MetA-pathway of phenol degradation